ncbi:hypothetical protein S40293_08676 [Stachybotrys chartarum IBT 40293]|nr:hypothetical protein S40293_08676 [Stachybotrys chartarum IBT 40293]
MRVGVYAGAALLLAVLWSARSGSQDEAERTSPVPSGADPIYLVSQDLLDAAVSRPQEVPAAKEIVLLVHGTGATPKINWDAALLQPLISQGYQPYYLEVPNRLFLDTQITAEYISYAVKKISREHDTNISIISWSAGGLSTQWTLTFYPETRAMVRRHIGIGGSYRGSWAMVPLVYLNMYSPAVVQQLPWSNFLKALRKYDGGEALVPTVSIGSSTDLIVQPSFYGEGLGGFKDSWRLAGPLAQNIDIFKLCFGKVLRQWRLPHIVSHDSLLWHPATHKIIFSALRNEDTYLSAADVVADTDCHGGLAPLVGPGVEAIIPELIDYAPKQPVAGWPEVPIRNYAK